MTTGAASQDASIDGKYGETKDFSNHRVKQCPPPTEIETGSIVGDSHTSRYLHWADKVVDGKERRNQEVRRSGGCGRMKSRDYYTELARHSAPDTVILTVGCAKYSTNR